MRMLFTFWRGLGSLHPLVPIARAAEQAGHEVVFANARSAIPRIEQAGFRCVAAGLDGNIDHESLVPQMRGIYGKDRADLAWRYIFAGHRPAAMVPDLLELAATWRPDVVIRDDCEFGGCIAAEKLGIPHVAVHTVAFRPRLYEMIREPLNERRAEAGLPPDTDGAMPFRFLFLSPFPRGYLDPAVALPSTTRHLRPVPFDQSGEEALPEWISRLPDRPAVYVTLGTVNNDRVDIFRALIDGLCDEPLNLIVTVGRDQDPEQFGPQPDHVHVERYIPQTLLFPRCDLIINHGGSGTVMAALSHGLPMVIVPIAADQPENAERCADLGVARVIRPADLSPTAARDAVRAVLAGSSYHEAALRMRDEIAEMPGPEWAVKLLERLSAERTPLPG